MVFRNSEYVGELAGSSSSTALGGLAGQAACYVINPGNPALFPWLSAMAPNFERFRFNKLRARYKPEVNPTSATAVGKVMIGCNYDVSDINPTLRSQIESTFPHVDAMPYQELVLELDPNMLTGPKGLGASGTKFVTALSTPPGDPKLYFGGLLTWATLGNGTTSNLGELHIDYEVEFFTPALGSLNSLVATALKIAEFYSTSAETGATTGVLKNLLLASVVTNGLGVVNTAGSLVPPAGNYLILFSVNSNASGQYLANATVELYKNGNFYSGGSGIYSFQPGTSLFDTLTAQGFTTLQCNGTDYLSLYGAATFANGTVGMYGSIVLLAVS
jgi:hypothetical protein